MSQTQKPESLPAPSALLQWVGWVLGATSLLNLVSDIEWITLVGKLEAWCDAYANFVRRVGHWIFGWIDFAWMRVTESELHVLVIALVLIGADIRARLRCGMTSEDMGPPISILLLVLAMIIFVPGNFAIGAAAGVIFGTLLLNFVRQGDGAPPAPLLRRELMGVVGVFVVAVALNYTLFGTPH